SPARRSVRGSRCAGEQLGRCERVSDSVPRQRAPRTVNGTNGDQRLNAKSTGARAGPDRSVGVGAVPHWIEGRTWPVDLARAYPVLEGHHIGPVGTVERLLRLVHMCT